MRRIAISAALLAALAALSAAPPAGAETPEVRRHGVACPPTGCAPARRSSAASSLGFGAVVLATGWIARRRAAAAR